MFISRNVGGLKCAMSTSKCFHAYSTDLSWFDDIQKVTIVLETEGDPPQSK